MKRLTGHLWFETPHWRDYLYITGQVGELARTSGVQEGICLVKATHITDSAIIIRTIVSPSPSLIRQ
ncbi:MAG: hypothetical protein ABSF51_03440 [Verrucomicrobiota bacterium]